MMELAEGKGGGNAGISCTNGMMGYDSVQTAFNLIQPLPLFSSHRVHELQLRILQSPTVTPIICSPLFIYLSTYYLFVKSH